jgi:hypothetical protein
MSHAQTVSEPMTWSEICERFPDQWIALVALDWTDDRDEPFRTALVAGYGSRNEALKQAKPLLKLFDQIGPFFTGDPRMVPPLPPIVYVEEVCEELEAEHHVGAAPVLSPVMYVA